MINIAGPMRLTQLVAPMLINTAKLPGRKRTVVVNVNTAGAGVPIPLFGLQLGTKVSPQVSRGGMELRLVGGGWWDES